METGNLWCPGKQCLICGDARDATILTHVMGGDQARMVLIDPPYNVPIADNV